MKLDCVHYNRTDPDFKCEGSFDQCKKKTECSDEHGCFLVWHIRGERLSAGCNIPKISHDETRCDSECIGIPRGDNGIYYCCCSHDSCNYNYTIVNKKQPKQLNSTIKPFESPLQESQSSINPLWSIVPTLFLIILLGLYIHRFRRTKSINRMMIPLSTKPQTNNNGGCSNNNSNNNNNTVGYYVQNIQQNNDKRIDLNNIKLLEVIGQGRFGVVHRAILDNVKEIAVKVIKPCDYQSWVNEQCIYNSPKIRHNNILNCIYSDEHVETDNYWLVVEYAPRGSLHCYLKDNMLNWKDFLHIALGIVQGLSHLHEADIAHGDFKSKNVLLKQDLTPCITDFGVAVMLDYPNGSHFDCRKKFLQVGTPRYMAPEVLECSVTFTKSSFFKIDVYALSLVLWELLSRCYPLPNHNQQQTSFDMSTLPPPPPYKLPFEDIAGPHPTIDRMRQIVVVDKQRPPLREEWRSYPISDICRAIEDGWEYDHDARISASCFVERVANFGLQGENEEAEESTPALARSGTDHHSDDD